MRIQEQGKEGQQKRDRKEKMLKTDNSDNKNNSREKNRTDSGRKCELAGNCENRKRGN